MKSPVSRHPSKLNKLGLTALTLICMSVGKLRLAKRENKNVLLVKKRIKPKDRIQGFVVLVARQKPE